MPVETATQAIRTSQATIAVLGEGPFAEAVGALLSARNHRVLSLNTQINVNKRYDLTLQNRSRVTNTYNMTAASLSAARSSDAIIVAVPATRYDATFESLANHLNSGQVVFIAGAAFGAALQAEAIMQKNRKDLAVSIVEVSRPFVAVECDTGCVYVSGVKEAILLSGCSLNATRNGISVGGGICNGMVPASNLLERGFSEMERWLQTAALLFSMFNPRPNEAVSSVMSGLKNELQTLSKAYGVNRFPAVDLTRLTAPSPGGLEVLRERIAEDFVILSGLARLKHVACPVLDAVIDLGSSVTGCDLRKQGRQLSDLGLIGMDAREIIELVSA
jgi:hypothetical protein